MNETHTVSELHAPAAPRAETPRELEAEKHPILPRQKTWGERVFNWRTYGGIALLGNEAASLAITESMPKMNLTKNWYAKKLQQSANLTRYEWMPVYFTQGHLFKVLIAVIGGMLMVPFVKYAEDHKGEQVRKLDRDHYGKFSDTDPKLIEAHKEMDEAPKQTWGSLWKGRLLTVVSAIGVDYTVGKKVSPVATLSKNSTYQRFSSMEAISERVAEASMKHLNVSEKAGKVIANGTWLLTLSGTLTVLFYASSKLFAKRSEQKMERKVEQRIMGVNGAYATTGDAVEPQEIERTVEKPTAQVSSISRADTTVSTPQRSQSM